MKKIPLLVILFFAWSSHAQTLIPKAGLTLSKIALADDDEQKFNPGLTIGVAFNFPVSEVFSIQPEISFVQKGSKSSISGDLINGTYTSKSKISMNYIEMPVLVKATFGESTKFFFTAGPSLGIGVGGKFEAKFTISEGSNQISETYDGKVKFGETPQDDDEELDALYFDNRLDFGVQLGAGVTIADKVMIDLRYGLGLSRLNDKIEDFDFDNKAQNRVIQLTVGVPIRLKK